VTTAAVLALAGAAEATPYNATLNSRDEIIGESESGGASPGYYPGSAGSNQVVGVSGASGSREHQNAVIGFILPVLDGPIAAATFSIEKVGVLGTPQRFVDLYGLGTTNPDVSGTSLFLEAATDGDPANTKLKDRFAQRTGGPSGVIPADVTAFIQGFYTGNAPDQAEVFFRLNVDTDLDFSGQSGIRFDTSGAALEIETSPAAVIPEPVSALVVIIGGGALVGYVRRRRP
jgi:hypothetical protein